MTVTCDIFANQPLGAYRPLSCKQDIITTRNIEGTGKQNKANYFFLMKPNTIREYATLDLLYPTPAWLRAALQKTSLVFARVVVGGTARVTTDNFLRVTA